MFQKPAWSEKRNACPSVPYLDLHEIRESTRPSNRGQDRPECIGQTPVQSDTTRGTVEYFSLCWIDPACADVEAELKKRSSSSALTYGV